MVTSVTAHVTISHSYFFSLRYQAICVITLFIETLLSAITPFLNGVIMQNDKASFFKKKSLYSLMVCM